jgi:hypothetical protein
MFGELLHPSPAELVRLCFARGLLLAAALPARGVDPVQASRPSLAFLVLEDVSGSLSRHLIPVSIPERQWHTMDTLGKRRIQKTTLFTIFPGLRATDGSS